MHTPVDSFYNQPWHITLGFFNELKKVKKEEAEAQKKAEKESRQGMSTPSMPSIQMPSITHY